MSSFYFHYQRGGKESKWELAPASDRASILSTVRPAFSTVLDLSTIPDDHDWSKTKYRGPMYFDLDAEGDLELVCGKFKELLVKLSDDLDFDLTQASYFASGSKGFHIEVPQECFIPKVPASGLAWLPYVYRSIAEALIVDTLDVNVYTGKRGRQWRTPNVLRDNGCYKVALSLDQAIGITPESYRELISAPRPMPFISPPSGNTKFQMLFERSRDKVFTKMRGRKKRLEKTNVLLDPWRKAKKHPPTIEGLMSGEIVSSGASFQQLAMQLSIYATTVGLSCNEFVAKCDGLIQKHVGDGNRYNTPTRRTEELARMWAYMSEDSMYEFDPGPYVKLVKRGTSMSDIGVIETEDTGDRPMRGEQVDGDDAEEEEVDELRGVRRGFHFSKNGMLKKTAESSEPVCRATLRNITSFFDLETSEFRGYEFDVVVKEKFVARQMLSFDAFLSATSIRRFFLSQQLSWQGGDTEAQSMQDVMAEKSNSSGKVYSWPREGLFVLLNPIGDRKPIILYLTKTKFVSEVSKGHPNYFILKYRPGQAISSYNIDVDDAPLLDDSMIPLLKDLFIYSKPEVVADTLGWMVAAHYRSLYLYLFTQFPSLQIYGEAGSGKTKIVEMLARLHWYRNPVSVKSVMSLTPFALDMHASTSTSAPLILDEFKPRELKAIKGRYEKFKDVLKASYAGHDIGERGTINRGAENNLGMVKSKATAPIVFMGEAIEMETAIIERCVTVGVSQALHSPSRTAAFNRLKDDPASQEAISSLGRAIVEHSFTLSLDEMREEMRAIQAEIETMLPASNDEVRKRAAPRLIFNKACVIHGLRTLRNVLASHFGDEEFGPLIENLTSVRTAESTSDEIRVVQMHSLSEISKVISRLAQLSREKDTPQSMIKNSDYLVGDGWVEIAVERAYDRYRRYCALVRDTPLFDTVEAFRQAMTGYSPCTDKVCANSAIREEGSTETIVRFDVRKLRKEGVQSFRGD